MLEPAGTYTIIKYWGDRWRMMVCIPTIKLCNGACILTVEDLDEMCKNRLPNTQLKLMHEVHNKKGEKVQPKLGKGRNECALQHN